MPFDPPFSGYIQPPGVPPDPTGDCWRGPAGPVGPPGPPGNMDAAPMDGFAYGLVNSFWNRVVPTTQLGMAAGQVPVFSNRSGHPSYELGGQWIINQTAPGPTVSADVFIRHDGTGVTTGSAATINKLLQLAQGVDTNDPNTNWSLLVATATYNTLGAKVLPAYFQMWRQPGSNAHMWGQVTEVHCFTGSPSSVSGPAVTQEWDLVTSGADDAVNSAKFGGIGTRSVIHMVVGRDQGTALNEITHAIWIGTGSSYIDSVIGFELSGGSAPSMFIQALDTRGAIVPTGYSGPLASVRMSASQIIDFNGGPALNSAPGNYLRYETATSKLFYYVGGVAKWSVDASGNMRCAGTVTGSVTP